MSRRFQRTAGLVTLVIFVASCSSHPNAGMEGDSEWRQTQVGTRERPAAAERPQVQREAPTVRDSTPSAAPDDVQPSESAVAGSGGIAVVGSRSRPLMGLSAEVEATGTDGLRIESVSPGYGAARAGLRQGDVIVTVKGVRVRSIYDIHALLEGLGHGDFVQVVYRRGNQRATASVELTVPDSGSQ